MIWAEVIKSLTSWDEESEYETYGDTVSRAQSVKSIVITSLHQLYPRLDGSNEPRHLVKTETLKLHLHFITVYNQSDTALIK